MAGPSSAAPASFSYAQAARGTSKPATTPNKPTGASNTADAEPSKDWAEDSERAASAKEQTVSTDAPKPDVKSNVVERTKSEDKFHSQSGVSSPDNAASATSHDETSSALNGSSQTSWEAKSQVSENAAPTEPSWIAEREKRQNMSQQKSDSASTDTAITTSNTAPKAPLLHEAPPPAVNVWAKRAEDAKTKVSSTPAQPSWPTSKDSNTASSGPAKPRASAPSILESNAVAASKPQARSSNENARPIRQSSHKTESPAEAPTVRDNGSWPTPETSVQADKKSQHDEHTSSDKTEEGQGKPRKKQDWKPMPVTPNVIFQTPGVRERGAPRSALQGDRAPRGGAGTRGRGGYRGASNAVTDRSASATEKNTAEDATRGRADAVDREAMPPPSKPERASSGSSRNEADGRHARQFRKPTGPPPSHIGQSPSEVSPHGNNVSSRSPAAPTVNGVDAVSTPQVKRDSSSETTNSNLANGQSVSQMSSAQSDGRKDYRDTYSGPTRGARRGRGRGGSRDVMNGHAYPFTNGHPSSPDFPLGPNQYGMPMSPTFPSRGGMYNNYRGAGPRTSGNRTNSYPMDAMYGRFNPYMAGPLPPLQTFAPMMHDINGLPASVIGFPGQADPHMYLLTTVNKQLDWYFSVDNLLGDIYLRKNMDSQGFVPLDVIAQFKKLAQLTTDRELLKAASLQSEIVEIKLGDDGKERLRKASGWEQFVLAKDQRLPAAQNDGPQRLETINRMPYFPFYSPHTPGPSQSHPSSPYHMSPADMRSSEHSAPMTMMSPHQVFVPDFVPGQPSAETNNENSSVSHFSPPQSNGHSDSNSPVKPDETEQTVDNDVFPDQQIEQLTVCVKMSKERLPYHNSAARTFSNGSIDTSIVAQNGEKESQGESDSKSSPSKNEDEPTRESAQDVSVFWIKDNDKPVDMLPSDLVPEPYVKLREKAFEQRKISASGVPYDFEVLYQFWSHFLIRNFNNSMYAEFKRFAEEDAKQRHNNVGQQNLTKYYDQALTSGNPIPTRVAKDYLAAAKSEKGKPDGLAFKSLHRSWRNGALNFRNRKRMSDVMDEEIRRILES